MQPQPAIVRVATLRAVTLAVALFCAAALPARSFAQGTNTPPSPPAPGTMVGHDAPPPQQPDQSDYPRLKITGFGDLSFVSTKRIDGPRGFVEGQFVLHMASALSPRATFFGELSFTPRTDAGTGSPPATGFNAEVERLILRLDQSDRLKLSFGRYHTPINWWNTAFHHGSWLQTTINRPEMIQFGGRLLPVHFVGALVEGSVPAGGMNFNYQAGLGNGRASIISRAGDAGDVNGNRAYLFNGFVKPDAAYGLQAGGAYYDDLITLPAPDSRNFSERIVSGYAAWTKEEPEVIGEYAGVRHVQDIGGLVTWSHAFYVQVAYRLPQFDRLWKPYYRFEHIGVNGGDVVFQNQTVQNLEDSSTLGIRYDATTFAAIKAEYRNWSRISGQPRNYGGYLQVCFTF